MLKHVEQSVAEAAWGWFRRHNASLAVYYEPHMETDPRLRLRFSDAVTRMEDYAKEVAATPDSEKWGVGCYEASFLVVMCFKQAMDAVGPNMLRQMHARLGHDAGAPPPRGAVPQAPPVKRTAVARPPSPRSQAKAKRQLRKRLKGRMH